MEYTEVDIRLDSVEPFADILVARFNEINFDSFLEDEKGLKAYVQTQFMNQDAVQDIIKQVAKLCSLSYTIKEIKQENKTLSITINEILKKQFRPEFMNRIDEIIIFETLTEDQIKEIVNLMTVSVEERLSEQNLSISVTEAAKSWIAEKGFDPVYGARPLRRVIQRELENKLARRILEGEFGKGDQVIVDVSKDGLNFEKNT